MVILYLLFSTNLKELLLAGVVSLSLFTLFLFSLKYLLFTYLNCQMIPFSHPLARYIQNLIFVNKMISVDRVYLSGIISNSFLLVPSTFTGSSIVIGNKLEKNLKEYELEVLLHVYLSFQNLYIFNLFRISHLILALYLLPLLLLDLRFISNFKFLKKMGYLYSKPFTLIISQIVSEKLYVIEKSVLKNLNREQRLYYHSALKKLTFLNQEKQSWRRSIFFDLLVLLAGAVPSRLTGLDEIILEESYGY